MPPIPTPAIQGTPPPVRSMVLRDFTGGINWRNDAAQLAPNEVRDAVDVDIVTGGGFKRRDSFRALGSSGLPTTVLGPLFLFHFPPDDDGTNGTILVGSHDANGHDKLVWWNETAIAEGHAPTSSALFTNDSIFTQRWSGALMKRTEGSGEQNLYIHRDYRSKVQTFQTDLALHSELTNADGNYNEDFSNPIGGTMPFASLLCTHQDYMFHADTYESSARRPARIRWSHPGHPGDYRADDFADVGEGQDNDLIAAICSWSDTLFIFKHRSVWALEGYDSNTFSLTKIADGVGCGVRMSAVSTMDGVVFFDKTLGLHTIKRTQGTWTVVPMWSKLNQAIKDGRITNSESAQVAFVGKHIYVSGVHYGSTSQPSRTFVLDTENPNGGWWSYSVGATLMRAYTRANGSRELMLANPFTSENGATATYFDRVVIQNALSTDLDDKYDSSETTYTGRIFTSWLDMGDPVLKKRFRRVSLVMKNIATNANIVVSVYKNWIAGTVARTMNIAGTGSSSDDVARRGGTIGTALSTSLKIEGPATEAWRVEQVTLRFIPQRVV